MLNLSGVDAYAGPTIFQLVCISNELISGCNKYVSLYKIAKLDTNEKPPFQEDELAFLFDWP
jgi:hypothetical protein